MEPPVEITFSNEERTAIQLTGSGFIQAFPARHYDVLGPGGIISEERVKD
jgi:hypothetical protein